MQTNEVQRAWALLPGFLTLADGRPLDLLELGPSAGLNLVWDRYGYRYATGSWGGGGLVLTGDDRVPPPSELLARRGRGRPAAWHRSQPRRCDDRRRRSAACRRSCGRTRPSGSSAYGLRSRSLRADPPDLIRGDYVESLPAVLADRRAGAQQVVFQTASTVYVGEEGLTRLRAALEEAAQLEPIAFLSSGHHADGYALELERYPGGTVERLGVFDFHGAWLEWGR